MNGAVVINIDITAIAADGPGARVANNAITAAATTRGAAEALRQNAISASAGCYDIAVIGNVDRASLAGSRSSIATAGIDIATTPDPPTPLTLWANMPSAPVPEVVTLT